MKRTAKKIHISLFSLTNPCVLFLWVCLLSVQVSLNISHASVIAEQGKLNIGIADETHSLDIKQCSASTTKQGQLEIFAEVYASGLFRNTPAVVHIMKSNTPNGPFQTMEIRLLELQDDEQTLSFNELKRKRDYEYNAWYNPKVMEIQSSVKITDDMSIEEINEQMNQQSEAYDALNEEAEKRQTLYSLDHGNIEIGDGVVSYQSDAGIVGTNRASATHKAFLNLENQLISVVAKCN